MATKEKFVMALDVGGGSGRCLLLGLDSGSVWTAQQAWTHPSTPNTNGLGFDLDITDVLTKLGRTVRDTLARANAAPGEVIGIATTSMRNTTVVLDADGGVLMATPNRDVRALGEGAVLAMERGGEVHEISGHWPTPIFLGTRLLWMKNNAPDLLKRARTVLSLSDWVGFWLSGAVYAERSQAGETLLFSQEKRQWAVDLIESLGLLPSLFPPIVEPGARMGSLTKAAADVLGLVPGIPVAAGGADTQCGLLGAGVIDDGALGVIAGTTMPLQLVTDRLVIDSEGRLWTGQHVVPGLFVLESNGMMTGDVIDWFSQIMYGRYSDPVAALCAEAATAVPGASGVYSTLGAVIFDGRALGIPVGNLSLSHMVTKDAARGRPALARAVLEGIAYSVRANLEQIADVSGRAAGSVTVTGGMSKSALWTGIVADVTGMPIRVPQTHEASALGAAILAGVGAGVFSDPATGARAVCRTAREHQPTDASPKYQDLYAGWRRAHTKRYEADKEVESLLTMSLFESSPAAERAADPSFRPKILVTASMDDRAVEALKNLGDVTYGDWRTTMTIYDGGQKLAEALAGVHVLITEMDIVDYEAILDAADLRMIVCCRGNAVNVDVASATAFGIPVVNTPGRNSDAVADLTVAFMVMLARKMPASADFLKQGGIAAGDMARMGEAYLTYQGNELWRKTVGLVGLGSVGAAVARRVAAFGARVVYFDPGIDEGAGALLSARKVSLDELLSESDFVSLHAPAIEATKGMMDRNAFATMKQGAFFINTARASLVDDDALRESLESGRLAGAALDVFSVEPPASDDPVVSRSNVIATPHIGGNTAETAAHQGAIAAEELSRLLKGQRPEFILNPDTLESFSWSKPRPVVDEKTKEKLSKNKRPTMTS
jgi:sugar (pentulose or hexulose) kinase/phosphoglycerate dehydrogenase-like enzyme